MAISWDMQNLQHTEPLNNFSVLYCQILKTSNSRRFSFAVRCYQLSLVVERTFAVDSSFESFFITYQKIFSETRSRLYAAEITLALKYLHKNKIIYRGLKLENLLLDENDHVKITDFGLCKEEISFSDKTQTFCGTPEYLAPEVLEDNEYGLAVDWWAFGVVFYETICGRLPFYDQNYDVLFRRIISEPERYPSKISTGAKSILQGLLDKNPRKRLGCGMEDATEVMEHEFFGLIDWNDIYYKKIPPPFLPVIKNAIDARKFSAEFTSMEPKLSTSNSGAFQFQGIGIPSTPNGNK